ncbi:MAG TPA: HNH endonuclease [Candidatus Paceibacterota bacterium]
MDFKFKRRRLNAIPEDKIVAELERAAKHFNYVEFAWRDFNNVADISATTVKRHFGNWRKALAFLRNRLQEKGLDLSARPHAPNRIYSDKELFDEMERIWQKVGQRPSRTEWEMSEPKIAYQTYKQRFGGWVNACSKFIEYKMGDAILADDFVLPDHEDQPSLKKEDVQYKKENSRNISLSLRLQVLNRDNFRCVFCGKSPATDLGTKLHIDHIQPFSRGGKSELENLQTLCEECNLGKSNKQNISTPTRVPQS